MKEKSNEATPNRPKGDRVLNAPLVEMDLNQYINQIKQEKAWENSDHNSITLFKSKQLRILLIGLHENGILKEHKTQAVISVQCIQGKIRFNTAEKSVVLEEKQMLTLQPGIPHSVEGVTEGFFLLSLSMPVSKK